MFVSPQIVSTLRDRIFNIATDVLNQNRPDLWWRDVAQEEFGQGETEIYTFALAAAKLQDMGVKGQGVAFDSRTYLKNSVTHHYFREGFTLTDGELTDLDSNRIQAAVDWVRDITADGIYNPQRLLAAAILTPTTKAYDGKNFFATDHFTNGKDAVAKTFGNLWVGSSYDISGTDLGVAVNNFASARQKIKVLKDPAGKPRNLRIKAVLAPAPLYPRLVQIIQAQFAPGSVTGGGGGTQDIAMLSSALGFGKPLEAVELGTDFDAANGNDKAYYFVCEYAGPHAPFVLSNREPFRLFENSMGSSAELARINAWEWIYSGRQALMPMHPYLIHKFSPT